MVCADTLDDLVGSSELAKLEGRGGPKPKSVVSADWFEPGTNFSLLMTSEQGPKDAIYWLFSWAHYDRKLSPKIAARDESMGVEQVVKVKTGEEIKVTVLIPYPKFRESVALGLVNEFSRWEPPQLKVSATEDVKLGNFDGKFYQESDGSCSILVKLAGETRVRTATSRCANSSLLLAFANQLDFERLNQKLMS